MIKVSCADCSILLERDDRFQCPECFKVFCPICYPDHKCVQKENEASK